MKKVRMFASVLLACALTFCAGVTCVYANPTENTAEVTAEAAAEETATETGTTGEAAEHATVQAVEQAANQATPLAAGTYTVRVATTGGGSATLSTGDTTGTSLSVPEGQQVIVSPTVPNVCYVAQVRYAQASTSAASETSTTSYGVYTTVVANEEGKYAFTMPAGNVQVMVDYVSIVWDGTIDVTWYNTTSTMFYLQYPAQFAGLAAIVNGIFTAYPTETVVDDEQTGASHDIPSYAKYKEVMGVVQTGSEAVGNNLYGEFELTYKLTDTQKSYEVRTEDISITQRVVGDASFIVANTSSDDSGGPNGQNVSTTDDYWYGNDDFDGKVVYITSDLDFGGKVNVDGTWNTSSPLFMPVSGQYCMLPGTSKTNGYSKLSSSWNGTLDGLGHSFTNVYCERYANTEFGDCQSVGIVGRLGVHDSDYSTYKSSNGEKGNMPAVNPTVRQIVLESGYMSGRRSLGGIVGKIGHTSAVDLKDGTTGGIVEYCINKATVIGTDKKGIGGVVGAAWNKGRITGCANFGSVTCTTSGRNFLAGGIAGSCEVVVSNCYNVGTIVAGEAGSEFAEAIGTNNGGCTWSNCYYLAGSDSNQKSPGVFEGTGADTVHAFGSGETITTLTADALNNSGASIWKDDTTGTNAQDGVNYPVLYYQVSSFNPEKKYTITTENPQEGGTFKASASEAVYGTTITLSCTPDAGMILDYYTVNGARISGSSFVVEDNTTVTATFRKLSSATLTITLPDASSSDSVYELTVTKTGLIASGNVMESVTDHPVASGDTVYECDVLKYTATLKEGVSPADANKYYTGNFSYTTKVTASGGSDTTPLGGETYTVAASDTSLEVCVSDVKTAYKNWSTEADVSWYNENNPQTSYELTTAAQLAGLAVLVDNGTTFEGTTIALGADISLANTDGTSGVRNWTPIGYSSLESNPVPFKGTFDGKGHTISNMTINNTVSGCIGNLRGFFGFLDGATMQNVVVTGDITVGAEGASYICGGIAAQATAGCCMMNCTSAVNITTAGTTAGGIVGKVDSTDADSEATTRIDGCQVNATITAAGNATGTTGLGGIAGYAAKTELKNCVVTGALQITSGTSGNIGGMFGSAAGVHATTCVNKATITCSASGGNAGGMVGSLTGTSSIASCLNQGDITGSATYAAGFVGYLNGACEVGNAASLATIASTTKNAYAAGFVGYLTGSSFTIKNGYVTGSAAATNAAVLVGNYASGKLETSSLYYQNGFATNICAKKGSKVSSSPAATSKTIAELKALAPVLGKGFAPDVVGLNSGYPVPNAVQTPLLIAQRPEGVALGDVNMNNRINIVDAQIAYDIACGRYTESEKYVQFYALSDMDSDGVVDAADAFAIQYTALHS